MKGNEEMMSVGGFGNVEIQYFEHLIMVDKKEQEMKEEIASEMRKKDYYDILGIKKTATDTEIKKAYRTLALRFHPDKNNYEGAKQVFKKVSNAYTHLIDPEKRKHYDQFGPEEDRPRPQYRRANAQDFQYQEFDDIFQAFFGGMPAHHHHRRPRGNFRAYQFNNFGAQGQGQQGGFNFYYIFVIFFVIYTILPLFQSTPNYSSSPSYEHRIRRTTSKLNVEYYVNQKFMEEARNPEYKRKAEMEMDKEFLVQLEHKCQHVKSQKRNLEIYAYQHREGPQRQNYLARAKNVDMTACRMLQQISNNHEDYVRELTYMRY